MDIFRPVNLLIEMEDWLAKSQVKLGHLSYIEASRELWFKFEIASLIIENWERVLNVSWNDYHIWVEKQKIDLLIASENNDNKDVDWGKSGIVEFKTASVQLSCGGPINSGSISTLTNEISKDFIKRKNEFDFQEMIAITLCHHPVGEKDESFKNSKLIDFIEDNLDQVIIKMSESGFHLPQKRKQLPYIQSSFRGESYGFYSCGVWVKK